MKRINHVIDGAAISYFLAYKCLMEKNLELCNYYRDKISSYIFPALTLAAFSCELALKARIKDECGKIKRGHDLEKLFRELTYNSCLDLMNRTRILYDLKARIYKSSDSFIPLDFNRLLSLSKDTFTTCRYFYEGSMSVNLDFLEALMFCLNDVDDDYQAFILKFKASL